MRQETSGIAREPVPLRSTNLETTDSLVFGGNSSSLVISTALITKIWDQAREGIRSLRIRGLEVGGLLLGRRGVGVPIVVEEIIPLPIEYRDGPSFQMSASDLATIAPVIEAAHGGARVVVGFYRSRTRGEEALRASDRLILEAIEKAHSSFAEDFRCCVILAPKSLSIAIACVVLRDGNGWTDLPPVTLESHPHPTVPESQVTVEKVPRAREKAGGNPLSASIAFPVSEQRVREPRATRISPAQKVILHLQKLTRREQIGWWAALGLIALTASMWVAIRQFVPPPNAMQHETPRTHLGFSATWEGPRWKLTWDSAAIDTLHPVGGVLSIDDGVFEHQVPLALPELASGTLFYTPSRENLTFSLRIDRGGSQVEEHVRVVVAPVLDTTIESTPKRPRSPAVNPAPILDGRWNREEKSSPSGGGSKEPILNSTTPTGNASQNVAVASAPSNQSEVTPAEVSSAPAPAPRLLAATPAEHRDMPALIAKNVATGGTGPAASVPVAANYTAALASSQRKQSEGHYVGPKMVQHARPRLPENVGSGLEVQLIVEIDTQGKVTKVTPIHWNSADAPLAVWAVRTVSSWAFEPAQLDGKVVPSQMDLVFRIRASSAKNGGAESDSPLTGILEIEEKGNAGRLR